MRRNQLSIIYILLFAAAILMASFLQLPFGLTREGAYSLVLFLGAIFLWIVKALPLAITSFLCAAAMPILGVAPLNEVFSHFANNTFFFMIATYCLTIAFSASTIPTRVSVRLMRMAGTSSKKLLLFFTFGAAMFSSIMSNIPSCAIFCALILSIRKGSKELQENESLIKVLLIAITYAAVIGGFSTPAGSSANIFAINLFHELTGKEVSFLAWTCTAVPVVFVALLICCGILLLVFRPGPLKEETILAIQSRQNSFESMTAKEWKLLIITSIMFVLWILGTWVTILNTTVVAMLGMCLFFFPGIDVLTWPQFTSGLPWSTVFLIGGSSALAYGLSSTGADIWLMDSILPDSQNSGIFAALLICGLIAAVLHILIPSGTATIAIALPLFLQFTNTLPVNNMTVLLVCVFWSCVVFVMPIDAVTMVTYSTGYYNFKDLLKAGIPMYLILMLVSIWLIYALGMLSFL